MLENFQNLPLHNSKILPLQLFTRNELLHVGGRLKHSFLPKENHTQLFFQKTVTLQNSYNSNHHRDRDNLVSVTREKYWSVPYKPRCREVANVCIYIVKDKELIKPQQQLVSDLPESPSAVFDPPFIHTGVDYFGPITIKRGKQARASTGLDKGMVSFLYA